MIGNGGWFDVLPERVRLRQKRGKRRGSMRLNDKTARDDHWATSGYAWIDHQVDALWDVMLDLIDEDEITNQMGELIAENRIKRMSRAAEFTETLQVVCREMRRYAGTGATDG